MNGLLAKRQAFNDLFQSRFNVYLIAKKNNFIIILHLLLLIRTFQQRRLEHVTHVIVFLVRSWHHFLFLDIIGKKFKKKINKILNTVEKIIENGAFALWSKCSIFYNIFKYMIFQRRQNALLWSKALKFDIFLLIFYLPVQAQNFIYGHGFKAEWNE